MSALKALIEVASIDPSSSIYMKPIVQTAYIRPMRLKIEI